MKPTISASRSHRQILTHTPGLARGLTWRAVAWPASATGGTARLGAAFLGAAFLSAALLSTATPAAGQSMPGPDLREIPLSPTETHLTLISATPTEMRYSMEISGFEAFTVATPEGAFTRVVLPGFHASQRSGHPELPMMNRLISIPEGATPVVTIEARKTRVIDLDALDIDTPLFPAQPSMPKSADPATWPFVVEPAAYRTPTEPAELAAIVDLGRLRAVRFGRLEISPVTYDPVENTIEVTESLDLTIRFANADLAADRELRARTASPFFDPIYDRIEGARDAHDDHPNPVEPVVTMVIVTWPDYTAQLAPFAAWKTERGFRTIVASMGDPEVGWTKESVQAYLHGLYEAGTPAQPAPSFVLFVGDVDEMPTFQLNGDATDRPYCDVEGDLCPDMLYGRFSVTNADQLDAILEKTLMYEQFTMPDPSYLGEVVMIAGMDGSFGPTHANGQINYGTSTYFNTAHGIYSHTYLYPQSGSQDANIVQNVSDGVGFVNYTAHGSETSWADPTFTQSQVRNLQNDGEYCLVIGNCCLTSTYDVGECFAETWLRVADKGAIGYIGGSNSTYWDEDYWWGVGYRATVVPNPTYEDTGPGAYDGLFHDHGEDMDHWYVVNDALIFSGNLAVMESGSNLTTYYWNIYNLMGDPSLCAYMGVPTANPVVHPETVFTTWTSLAVEAAPGSYVGLTQDGVLIGAGTVDLSGALDVVFTTPPTPGPARLVVTGQNRVPYVTDLDVIIPAQVFMDPGTIPCLTETEVSVGVFEYDGVTPKPGVEVWAEGFLYESGHATTDATGYCTITVDYDYGPSVEIVGREAAASYDLFRDPLEVEAGFLMGASLSATTGIGLTNQFPLHLPAVLHANTNQPVYELHALLNETWLASTSESSLEVTADALGAVEGVLAVRGYDLVRRTFPVVEVHGTLAGTVSADGAPAVGAVVRGYLDEDVVFQTTVTSGGTYAVPGELVCGPYRMTVDLFGYLGSDAAIFVDFGANTVDVALAPAPAGLVSGTITEAFTGAPLAADIEVYRSDNGALYATTASDPLDGSYVFASLPYFDYLVSVRADRHVPTTAPLAVEGPATVLDFALERTLANLLVIDDDAAGLVGPRGQSTAVGSKASAELQAELEELGYFVTMETLNATQPGDWPEYDLLVVSSGGNTGTLASSTFRTALRSFVLAGGRLLIEGGEVGYDHSGDTNFARDVLHITGWNHDSSGNLTVATPAHPIASEPHVLTSPITCAYSGYGDQDALDIAAGAVRVGAWSNYPSDASLIAFDPAGSDGDGRIAFYAFNYSAVDANVRPLLLENTVRWLLPEDPAGVDDEMVPALALALGEPRPNPTPGASRFWFALPDDAVVDLAIYDVAGRRIRTLEEGLRSAGRHEASWDGRDDHGHESTSGIYFARLSTEAGARFVKLTVLR